METFKFYNYRFIIIIIIRIIESILALYTLGIETIVTERLRQIVVPNHKQV